MIQRKVFPIIAFGLFIVRSINFLANNALFHEVINYWLIIMIIILLLISKGMSLIDKTYFIYMVMFLELMIIFYAGVIHPSALYLLYFYITMILWIPLFVYEYRFYMISHRRLDLFKLGFLITTFVITGTLLVGYQ
ncbi:MAG: hypothetical protein K9L74_03455 [Candidatus Izimaplasma sp.]|nr:hypothetical protein [Candidatus Izimaplasma bacterium]